MIEGLRALVSATKDPRDRGLRGSSPGVAQETAKPIWKDWQERTGSRGSRKSIYFYTVFFYCKMVAVIFS